MNTLTAIFLVITAHHNLPPGLLSSLCYVESKHNPNATHHDDGTTDSIGLCQIKYKTAESLGYTGTPKDLLDPTTNAYFAGMYLKKQIKRYHGNIAKAVIAYNHGNARHLTTSQYQRKVFSIWTQNQKHLKMIKQKPI